MWSMPASAGLAAAAAQTATQLRVLAEMLLAVALVAARAAEKVTQFMARAALVASRATARAGPPVDRAPQAHRAIRASPIQDLEVAVAAAASQAAVLVALVVYRAQAAVVAQQP